MNRFPGAIANDKQLGKIQVAIEDLRSNLRVLEAIAEEFVEPCNTCYHLECICVTEEPQPPTLPNKYTTISNFLSQTKDISK